MHVRGPHNGHLLGARAPPASRHLNATHSPLPHHGDPGLGQNLCGLHEGDEHDVYGWTDDCCWCAAF